MPDTSFLHWPFFEDRHRAYAEKLEAWAGANLPSVDHHDVDAACRRLVAALGNAGFLQHTAPGDSAAEKIDVRTLALTRETLARHSGLADFAFAMQGLGMGAVSLFGTPAQQDWLARTRSGGAIAAFALTEPGSGSDVAATATPCELDVTDGVDVADGAGVAMTPCGVEVTDAVAVTCGADVPARPCGVEVTDAVGVTCGADVAATPGGVDVPGGVDMTAAARTAASTSARTMRPPGPEPVSAARSTPLSRAMRRASGDDGGRDRPRSRAGR